MRGIENMADEAMLRRQRAVEAVQAKFAGKSFLLGRRDCIRLASMLLRALGHKPPAIPAYKTELMAARRLKEHGADDLAGLLDGLGLPRRAPATALLGDLLFMPGEGEKGIGALTIADGMGAMLGYHGSAPGLVWVRSDAALAAWNVLP